MARLLLISAESLDDRMPTRVKSIAGALSRRGDRIFLLANAGQYTRGSATRCLLKNLMPHVNLSEGVVWISPPTLRLPTVSGTLKVVLSFFNSVSAVLATLFALEFLGLDAVYSSTAQTQGLIGSILRAILRTPLVLDYGDPSFARDTGSVRRIDSLMENLSLRECDLVISSDPVISNYIERRTGKSSFFLPNGYDPLFSQVRFHEGRPLAERRNIIIFVGKIDLSVYRLDILLVAAREVVDRIPDAIFRFVGAGRDLARLKRLAGELGVERAIDFVGSVPHENVASLLRESKVCIHLTNDTCLGQKVMEYMASGKPVVIASPWWRKYKVLLKNGYNCVLVPLDAGMVATAILKVMRNQRLAARLSINAFNTARRHTWDNVAARLYDVMRNKRGFRSPRLGEAE